MLGPNNEEAHEVIRLGSVFEITIPGTEPKTEQKINATLIKVKLDWSKNYFEKDNTTGEIGSHYY